MKVVIVYGMLSLSVLANDSEAMMGNLIKVSLVAVSGRI